MFGDKISSDKAKINVIKMSKRRKLGFMMLCYKTLKMATLKALLIITIK